MSILHKYCHSFKKRKKLGTANAIRATLGVPTCLASGLSENALFRLAIGFIAEERVYALVTTAPEFM